MAPKKGGGAPEKVEARTTTTAVLLADSFTQRFRPITVERPKVLLPLVNTPMIEYTLEWLALNRVEEVFIFCCAHADQIGKYVEASKWSSETSTLKVVPIVSTNCLSAGEALRVIEQRDVIKGDFILVSGDIVSNMALKPVLEEHRARREKDKNAIMTMVMKKATHPKQRLRLGDTDLFIAVDPDTQRLLKYVELDSDKPVTTIKTDAAFFSERDRVQIRSDLMDTNIAICAPEVLLLFSDNFDYQNVKRDFVSGVLSEEELGNKLFIYELSREYAARIHNLRSYDAVSRDILQRWVFPFVPDTNVLYRAGPMGPSTYRYGRGHRYYESKQVTIARFAALGPDVAVGAGTSIGNHSCVTQSTVGRNCRIGRHVNIEGSYLQDNVTVEDGAVLQCALLCEGAIIRAGAVVGAGAIISYNCVIAARHQVPPNVHISLCRQLQAGSMSDDDLEYSARPAGAKAATVNAVKPSEGEGSRNSGSRSDDGSSVDSYDDDKANTAPAALQSREKPSEKSMRAASAVATGAAADAAVQFDTAAVGVGGAGYKWAAAGDGGDSGRYSIAPPSASRPDLESTDDGDAEDVDAAGSASADELVSDLESDEAEAEVLDPESVFKREVGETFLRCVKLKFDQTNAVVELNSLKIAENRTFADCARYILTMLLSLCLPIPPHINEAEYGSLFAAVPPDVTSTEGKVALLRAVKKLLAEWTALLRRFLKNEDDQVELLLTLEEFCSGEGVFEAGRQQSTTYEAVFPQLLQQLYEAEVLGEEAILAWADEKSQADADDRAYLDKAAKFIDWLRTADSDEEEDDSNEEGEDDE